MGKLDGKIVLLTGAASGLGKHFAIRCAAEGAKLAICSRTESKLMETKRLCEEKGAEVLAFPCDVRSYDALSSFVDKTVERFGTIDVLVNNAHQTTLKPFLDQSIDDFQMEIETSLFSTWHLMKLCFPYLKDKPGTGASIINFGSRSGMESQKFTSTYATVKEAIRTLSRVTAREWGVHNIRVNILCPTAYTDNIADGLSNQPPEFQKIALAGLKENTFRRLGDPYEDVAPILVFLASDESHWLTGQTVNADGGGWITA